MPAAPRQNNKKPAAKNKPVAKPIEAPQSKKPLPRSKTSRQHENFDDDPDSPLSNGRGDYQWSVEDSTTDTARALEAFMGKSDLRKESELNEDHIRAASLLLEMAGRYKLPRIRNAVHHFLACRVSKDRGSREEAVQAFVGLIENRRIAAQDNIANALRREI